MKLFLNLYQWFRRKCHLNVFLIWSSGSPFVKQSKTICAILVAGIMRNNSVKLFFKFGPVVQEEVSIKRFLIWSSGMPPVQWSGTINVILKKLSWGTLK